VVRTKIIFGKCDFRPILLTTIAFLWCKLLGKNVNVFWWFCIKCFICFWIRYLVSVFETSNAGFFTVSC